MNPAKEIEEAIDSAASSIMRATELKERNDLSQARKSLLLARIDLEFAAAATHLMNELEEETEYSRDAGKSVSLIESTAKLNRIVGWLDDARNLIVKREYKKAEAILAASTRVAESNLKALEKGLARHSVRRSSRVASSYDS